MRLTIAAFVISLVVTADARQTFRTSVEAVRVDVLVLDGNRPVGGLRPGDFELRDSGVVQQVDSVAFEDVPLSVMLALDASSSVRGKPLEDLKRAAEAVVALLEPDDRAAVLTFSSEIGLAADWTADRQRLDRAIATADASGATALHDAAYTSLMLKDPQQGRAMILIFSDGDDTVSWLPGQPAVDLARQSDAVIYSVGLRTGFFAPGYLVDFRSGLQPDIPAVLPPVLMRSLLSTLADESGGKYIAADRSDQLRDTFVHILTEFRSRYLVSYTPSGVDARGWHPIEVKLKNKKGKVTARRGYLR
jgi:VWFA-related protein